MQDNIDIIKKAMKRNKRAFYYLINEYTPYLYKIAYLQTKYEEDAIKIFEETVYNGFNNIHKLRSPQKFKIWMTRILINEIDYFLESVGMIENNLEITNEKIDLYSAIDTLESKVKSVIILKFYCKFTDEEISEVLDINANTVNNLIRRGLKEMKGLLVEECV